MSAPVVLARPPAFNEETAHDAHPYSSCGQACVASLETLAGKAATIEAVDATVSAGGFPTDQGTSLAALQYALQQGGVAADVNEGQPLAQYAPTELAAGKHCIILHQCNIFANPVPRGSDTRAHWRVLYGDDGANYLTMTPWPMNGNAYTAIPHAELEAADLLAHLAPQHPIGGLSAMPDGFWNGLAVLVSLALLGRERPDVDPQVAAELKADPGQLITIVQGIVNDPGQEFAKRQAAIVAAIALANAPAVQPPPMTDQAALEALVQQAVATAIAAEVLKVKTAL